MALKARLIGTWTWLLRRLARNCWMWSSCLDQNAQHCRISVRGMTARASMYCTSIVTALYWIIETIVGCSPDLPWFHKPRADLGAPQGSILSDLDYHWLLTLTSFVPSSVLQHNPDRSVRAF